MTLRKPRPVELAAYLAWSGDYLGRVHRRWAEIRPPDAEPTLTDRDLFAHALLLRLAPDGLPRGYNSRQARAWVASHYADHPDAVKVAARAYLAERHRIATERSLYDADQR